MDRVSHLEVKLSHAVVVRKLRHVLVLVAVMAISALSSVRAHAAEPAVRDWRFDWTVYFLAAGMTGDVAVRGIEADVDVPFGTIWDNLKLGAMTSVRATRGRWALNADVIYMKLGVTKESVTAEMSQWVVEPSLNYRLTPALEVLAGIRYNSLEGEIHGPVGNEPAQTVDWVDPIVGAHLGFPLGGHSLMAHVRGDVGGFGVGSDLTWQAFPYLTCRLANWCTAQGGYRWVDTDYESGSDTEEFVYDVLTQGPQLGVTFHF